MARFEVKDHRDGNDKHMYYSILLDGCVQITGCWFDNKGQYERAVAALNAALEAGKDVAEVVTARGVREWNMTEHNQGHPVLPVNTNPQAYGFGSQLYHRGPNGYARAYGSDVDLTDLPKIPEGTRFQTTGYAYVEPREVYGWQWSTTFGKWTALVRFDWEPGTTTKHIKHVIWTYPYPG